MARFGAVGAALSTSGLLAACFDGQEDGSTSQQPSDASVDHVTWGISGQAPPGLDIASNWYAPAIAAASLGLEGLVRIDRELKLRPALAKSWTQPDPLHYVFELRPGVKFWDGTPLTVDDVVFSLNRHRDRDVASLIGFFFAKVKSIEATGDLQVTISLSDPDPAIPGVLVLSQIGSRAFIARVGKRYGTPGSAVNVLGTGPYEITSFTTEAGVNVERNPAYWGAEPKVRSATLKFFDNPQTSRLAAQGGEIDGVFDFPLSASRDWDRMQGFATDYPEPTGIAYLAFNMDMEPWSDIHVRRAVAYCADLAGYVRAFTNSKATPAKVIVPPAQWANVASRAEVEAIYDAIPQYPFDIERAKAELAQSAFPEGFTTDVVFPADRPEWGRALVSLKESLKEIGITLNVESAPQNEWLTTLDNKGHSSGLIMGGGGSDYPDPANYLMIFYPSENAVPGRFNLAHFKNERVDRLLEEQNATLDTAKRADLLAEILKISGEELPYLTLWWIPNTAAVADEYVYSDYTGYALQGTWLADVKAAV